MTGNVKDLGNNTFHERFRDAFEARRKSLGLALGAIATAIGHTDRTLRLWLAGAGQRGPGFRDIESIDTLFAALGAPGFMSDLRPPPRWRVEPLAFDTALPADICRLAAGLLECPADPLAYLNEQGWARRVHIFELYEDGGLRLCHLAADTPVRVAADQMTKDIREVGDREFGKLIHAQMVATAASRRPAVHRLISEQVTFDRLAIPVRNSGARITGRKSGRAGDGGVIRLLSIPHRYRMTVPVLALD